MVEIIAEFVAELPERIESIRAAVGQNNPEQVRRIAHQLKGAGGGYGFPTISQSAAEVERLLTVSEGTHPDLPRAQDAVRILLEICSCAVSPSTQNPKRAA